MLGAKLTSGMSVISLVVCHVDTHRVVPHGLHVVNSHVSILLLVAKHRIFTCDQRKRQALTPVDGTRGTCSRDPKRRDVIYGYRRASMDQNMRTWRGGVCTNASEHGCEPANQTEKPSPWNLSQSSVEEAKIKCVVLSCKFADGVVYFLASASAFGRK